MFFFNKKKVNQDLIDEIKKLSNLETINKSEYKEILNNLMKLITSDEAIKTNKKLEIYNIIHKLSNCTKEERIKFIKKLEKLI